MGCGICKECRHWDAPERSTWDGVRIGECQCDMVIRPTYGEGKRRVMRRDGVLTCDEGGGTDQLVTGPDFGCIHFERKET